MEATWESWFGKLYAKTTGKSWSCSDGKYMYEKAWYTSKVLVLPIQPIAFLTFSLRSPSWLLNCLLGLNEKLQLYPVLSFGPTPPAVSSRFSDFWPALFLLKASNSNNNNNNNNNLITYIAQAFIKWSNAHYISNKSTKNKPIYNRISIHLYHENLKFNIDM